MQINRRLLWDYDIENVDTDSEAFRRLYVSRVLTRGGVEDVKALGIGTIRHYVPLVHLPERIRTFWQTYFALLESHGSAQPTSEALSAPSR